MPHKVTRYVLKDASGQAVAFYDTRFHHQRTLADGSPNPAIGKVPESMVIPAEAVPLDDAEYESFLQTPAATVTKLP